MDSDAGSLLATLKALGQSDEPAEWSSRRGLETARLISDTEVNHRPGLPEAETVELPRWLSLLLLFETPRVVARAFLTLLRADQNTAIMCAGSHRIGLIICMLNRLLPIRRRKILLWGAFIETDSRLKHRMIRYAIEGASVSLVWSRGQVALQSEYLGIPQSKFIPTLYKANHSKLPADARRFGGFAFSGGNSQRDYETLFEAVRGTDVQLIVSTTMKSTIEGLDVPANVIVLQAREPAFMRLMAGSRFVVYSITPGHVRGAAEASIANAMWHGRAVICADNVTAEDYVTDGETGYVVPAGDVGALRERILELWNDQSRAEEMGLLGHERVSKFMTHEVFIQKLLTMSAELALSEQPT